MVLETVCYLAPAVLAAAVKRAVDKNSAAASLLLSWGGFCVWNNLCAMLIMWLLLGNGAAPLQLADAALSTACKFLLLSSGIAAVSGLLFGVICKNIRFEVTVRAEKRAARKAKKAEAAPAEKKEAVGV